MSSLTRLLILLVTLCVFSCKKDSQSDGQVGEAPIENGTDSKSYPVFSCLHFQKKSLQSRQVGVYIAKQRNCHKMGFLLLYDYTPLRKLSA